MKQSSTTRYDVAEHLRTPEEMAAYIEACIEESDGDAAFVKRAIDNVARAISNRCQSRISLHRRLP